MSRRWNANVWVLGILLVIVFAIGIDVARTSLAVRTVPPLEAAQPPTYYDPPFKRGDSIPDFQLPDASDQFRHISSLVRRNTLLTFSCGCNNCREYQSFIGRIVKKLGPLAPDVVTVTTQPKESEKAWIRDTALKQTILYEPKGGEIGEMFKGHPCPRGFMLDGAKKVRWWTSNMNVVHDASLIGNETATHLGLNLRMAPIKQTPPPGKEGSAPDFKTTTDLMPPPPGFRPGGNTPAEPAGGSAPSGTNAPATGHAPGGGETGHEGHNH